MFPSRSTIFALLFTACQVSALVIRTIGGGSGLSRRQSAGEVVTQCTEPNTVALTFDDGPFIYLNEIVDTLTEAGANGTFFFNGNNCTVAFQRSQDTLTYWDRGMHLRRGQRRSGEICL
ncbi:chitin deacetylase [Coprinopsis cinerea AmutBmut pab1-1]|nr:chitin deacetylase [Coprinopsis cinerea AmutBmut pab1-1]